MACNGECACSDLLPIKSLFPYMEIDKISVINEAKKGSLLEIIKASNSVKDIPFSCHSKDSKGLLVKIPFNCKVSLTNLQIKSTFSKLEVFTNNLYVKLENPKTSRPDSRKASQSSEYSILSDHFLNINISSKNKSVDTLTIRLTGSEGVGEVNYLCICGTVTGILPKAVNTTYEAYPVADLGKITEEMAAMRK
ncbi:hypothetical protein NEAUS03_1383 [Nematocida ausubeli]|nr:hypothetical protein NEAUS03_1383 [Nematocida ausubeli]